MFFTLDEEKILILLKQRRKHNWPVDRKAYAQQAFSKNEPTTPIVMLEG